MKDGRTRRPVVMAAPLGRCGRVVFLTTRRQIIAAAATVMLLASDGIAQDRPLMAPRGASEHAVAGEGGIEVGAIMEGSARPEAGALPAERALVSPDGRELEGGFMRDVLPTAAALGATLLAIVLLRSLVRRLGGLAGGARRPSGVVEILARYPVARGQQIVLVKVARRVIVACQTPAGLRTLSEFGDADEVADLVGRCSGAARGTPAFSFDALLRRSADAHDALDAQPARASQVAPAPAGLVRGARGGRDGLPAEFVGAEVETVDLTRRGRGSAR